MKFITVRQFIEHCFEEGSRPSEKTIIRMIKDGLIPGRRYGRYYIDMTAYQKMSGNLLVDRVLQNRGLQLPSHRRKKS